MVWLVLSMQIKIHTYIKWLKTYRPSSGLPKSGLVNMLRITRLKTPLFLMLQILLLMRVNEGSIYMAPLRVAELAGSNLVGYSATTKEVVDSGVATDTFRRCYFR